VYNSICPVFFQKEREGERSEHKRNASFYTIKMIDDTWTINNEIVIVIRSKFFF